MVKTDFNWYGSDGQLVFARTWAPDEKIDLRAVICLIHGMGEHSGRYQHVAEFFVKNNYAVIACDLRGHGQSEGKRGHVSSFDFYLGQVDKCLEESSKRFPGETKFIYGHSMGGNIVMSNALTHNPRVAGIISSAPWLRATVPVPSSKLMMARIANMFWGSYRENTGLDAAKLSHDEVVVKAYQEDSLVHGKISARLFFEGTASGEMCLRKANDLSVPMLIMHGTEDEITDPKASAEFAQKAGSTASFKEWPGMYHEIHNEIGKEEVLQYALDWLEGRLKELKSV